MIKVDIVNEVSKIADITKVKAEVAVDAVFDAMRTSMQRGDRIELRGFGVERCLMPGESLMIPGIQLVGYVSTIIAPQVTTVIPSPFRSTFAWPKGST